MFRRLALARLVAPVLGSALLAASCLVGGERPDELSGGSPAPALDRAPGPDAYVTVFDGEPLYFTPEVNRRTVDVQALLPDDGAYEAITLRVWLSCPSGGCDPWDRFASLAIVRDEGEGGAAGEGEQLVEIARFITPFGVGAGFDVDATALRPLLRGSVTFRAFIDTWVGPGSGYGDGWLLTVDVDMRGGLPARRPLVVLPVFPPTAVVYGDPSRPAERATTLRASRAAAASTATLWELRGFVTGHGQGNADNCAEFCARTHGFAVGDVFRERLVWRDDCAETAAPRQQGTWQYARAGWCPGADVIPWIEDVSDAVAAGLAQGEVALAWAVEEYENTCRPTAAACAGCTLGTTCDYDGGAHTEPAFQLSAVLVGYDEP